MTHVPVIRQEQLQGPSGLRSEEVPLPGPLRPTPSVAGQAACDQDVVGQRGQRGPRPQPSKTDCQASGGEPRRMFSTIQPFDVAVTAVAVKTTHFPLVGWCSHRTGTGLVVVSLVSGRPTPMQRSAKFLCSKRCGTRRWPLSCDARCRYCAGWPHATLTDLTPTDR